jgi:putative tryptophan/tyrosine transport system substrate-binding protein
MHGENHESGGKSRLLVNADPCLLTNLTPETKYPWQSLQPTNTLDVHPIDFQPMNEHHCLSLLQILRVFHIKFPWLVLLFLCLDASVLHSAETGVQKQKVAVLLSLNIRPYMEAVEGLRESLLENNTVVIEVFNMEDYTNDAQNILFETLKDKKFDICVTVGPEAARFVWSGEGAVQALKLYTMVLHPEEIVESTEPVCGISLDIPVNTMMQIFSKVLPSLKRIGLLYDPDNNSKIARQAVLEAAVMDLEIIPLEVSLRKQIPVVLSAHWEKIDGLWLIPDETVITESLVGYIIKESISHGKAVYGYNRFFYKNGAALCFILDYREIGKQTAQLLLEMLTAQNCKKQTTVFKTWYNPRILNRLGIEPVMPPPAGINIEPGP